MASQKAYQSVKTHRGHDIVAVLIEPKDGEALETAVRRIYKAARKRAGRDGIVICCANKDKRVKNETLWKVGLVGAENIDLDNFGVQGVLDFLVEDSEGGWEPTLNMSKFAREIVEEGKIPIHLERRVAEPSPLAHDGLVSTIEDIVPKGYPVLQSGGARALFNWVLTLPERAEGTVWKDATQCVICKTKPALPEPIISHLSDFPTLPASHCPAAFLDVRYTCSKEECKLATKVDQMKARVKFMDSKGLQPECETCGSECYDRCSRCKLAYFCDADCMKSGYKQHRDVCKAVASGLASGASN